MWHEESKISEFNSDIWIYCWIILVGRENVGRYKNFEDILQMSTYQSETNNLLSVLQKTWEQKQK